MNVVELLDFHTVVLFDDFSLSFGDCECGGTAFNEGLFNRRNRTLFTKELIWA